MAKTLGPTFGDEVIAAGLGGLPIAWGATDDTITGREHLTTAQNTTLDGVVAAHNPDKKQVVTTTEFVARFTNQEYLALGKQRAADLAANKVGFSKDWDILVSADTIDIHRQKAQKVKDSLVPGVLTQARADEIFS